MPPQQFQGLLDVGGDLFDVVTHEASLSTISGCRSTGLFREGSERPGQPSLGGGIGRQAEPQPAGVRGETADIKSAGREMLEQPR